MNEFQKNFDVQNKRLSIIDVSFEDDTLYCSPSKDLRSSEKHPDHKSVQLMMDAVVGQCLEDSTGSGEQILQTPGSSVKKSGKYNLRKSMAWDSAFFTSEGVLEAEELSSMIKVGEKSAEHRFPGIEEDVHKSSVSLSTLASDNVALETLESDLFGDIRASIEKTKMASSVGRSEDRLPAIEEDVHKSSDSLSTLASDNVALETLESDLFGDIKASIEKTKMVSNVGKSGKRESPAQVMLRNKAFGKNSKVATQGLGKAAKQLVPTSGRPTPALCKPSKLTGKVTAPLTTKRASLSHNHIKVDKEHAKISAGRNVKTGPLGSSRNAVPRPALHGKLSLGTSTAKPDISMSSSLDSCGSLSSDSSGKSLSNPARRTHSKTTNVSLGVDLKTKSEAMAGNKNKSTNSRPLPRMRSVNKLSSNTSPGSSVSEWSPELHSPNSNSSTSLDTVCSSDMAGNYAACKLLNFQKSSSNGSGHNNQTNGLLGEHARKVTTESNSTHPTNIRPLGLRMPSPKIGFFDGVKTVARSPKRNLQYHQTLPSGLPRSPAQFANPDGGPNKGIVGKLQPGTIVPVRGTKTNDPQNYLKPKSPLAVKEHASVKVLSASKIDSVPLKSRNRMTPEKVGERKSSNKGSETKSKTML